MVHIRLKNVSYAYPVIDQGRSLKLAILKSLVGGRILQKGKRTYVQALDDITLDLRPGDRLGLLGHNGAGKSTLLRLLAGLLPPTSGDLDIKGRIISLIQQGVGIQPELTGRENIELPLRMLGASDAEVARGKVEIPGLIDLGSFIDLPVRAYSDGMRARLSFGISTFLRGDILLLDEWLATGDAAFFEKASAHLKSYLDTTGIMVLASHDEGLIRAACNRVAVFDSGRLIAQGEVEPMIDLYLERTHHIPKVDPVAVPRAPKRPGNER